ncbi:MAG: Maf family protein [Aestuariivirgaceae bacterium]|nr:Maf family protein [Aestuariivirgaceae bacterium]
MTRILLASASATRRALLAQAGIVAETNPPQLDEEALKQVYLAEEPDISPARMAMLLAQAKAVSVSNQNPACVVIGGDQVLALGQQRFDKPKSLDEARIQLQTLRGKTHHLETAIACALDGEIVWSAIDRPALAMRDFSDAFLEDYLRRLGLEVTQTVGGYKLEGLGLQLFSTVEGDYFSILGLPLLPLLAFLRSRNEIGT